MAKNNRWQSLQHGPLRNQLRHWSPQKYLLLNPHLQIQYCDNCFMAHMQFILNFVFASIRKTILFHLSRTLIFGIPSRSTVHTGHSGNLGPIRMDND